MLHRLCSYCVGSADSAGDAATRASNTVVQSETLNLQQPAQQSENSPGLLEMFPVPCPSLFWLVTHEYIQVSLKYPRLQLRADGERVNPFISHAHSFLSQTLGKKMEMGKLGLRTYTS